MIRRGFRVGGWVVGFEVSGSGLWVIEFGIEGLWFRYLGFGFMV